MAYGLNVSGDSGVIQVDDSYTNLALKQSGSIWVPAGLSGASFTVYGVNNPLLFVRTSGAAVYVQSDNNPPNPTYTFKSGEATAAGTVYWYLFDDSSIPVSSGWGLSVYRADGSVAYNTDWKVLKIGAVAQCPNLADGTDFPSATAAAPYTATWAACICSNRIRMTDSGTGRYSYFVGDSVVTNTGGAYTAGGVIVATINLDENRLIQPYGGLLLIADVTGY